MGKKKYTTEYFDIKPIMAKYPDCTYYLAWGQRSDGKTYTGKTVLVEQSELIEPIDYEHGEKFIYLRRLHQHITRKNMLKEFDDVMEKFEKRFGEPVAYDSQIGFYLLNSKQVIGYAMAIEDAYLQKSIPIVGIKYIIFDEFIDYYYMENEIPLFLHTIKNICRPPNNVKAILMFGNTVNKFSPYFDLFKLDPKKMNMGECYYFKHKLGVSGVAIHTPIKVDDIVSKSKTDKYIGFDDNESVDMIMFGEWEYNHTNTKGIDGITWNCNRHRVNLYVTGGNDVYELSLYMDSKLPILFVRKVNTQQGKVKESIYYNLSYDNSVILMNKKGFVPIIAKVNSLVDTNTLKQWDYVCDCYNAGRVVYDTIETGSNFMYIFDKVGKK